jgi:biotin carboxylase
VRFILNKKVLVIEPGFEKFKGHLLKDMSEMENVDIYIASGGHEQINYGWTEQYCVDRFSFDYAKNNLLEVVKLYQDTKGINFDGVLTYVDTSVHFVNDLQHKLDLPVISMFNDKSIRNKGIARKRFLDAGIEEPKFKVINRKHKVENRTEELPDFPVIMKPTEMMMSLGIRYLSNEEELNDQINEILSADILGENLRSYYGDIAEEVIIEEYIEGPEFSAEVVVVNGKYHLVGITKKTLVGDRNFDELEHQFPYNEFTEELKKGIERMISKVVSSLRLNCSFVHIEFKIKNKRPYIIEVNNRLGGDLISLLIEKSTGISVGKLLVNISLGIETEIDLLDFRHQYCVHFVSEKCDGVFLNISHGEVPPSVEFKSYVSTGDVLFKNNLVGATRLAHIVGKTRDVKQFSKKLKVNIQKSFYVYQKGNAQIMVVRATKNFLNNMIEIEKKVWGDHEEEATGAMIKTRFNNGCVFFLAIDILTGENVGFYTGVPLKNNDIHLKNSWYYYNNLSLKIDDADTSQYSHHFGLNLSVLESAPTHTGLTLMRAARKWCINNNIQNWFFGMRVPGFSELKSKNYSIYDHIKKAESQEVIEPLIRISQKIGAEFYGVVPDYFKDPMSGNWGAIYINRFNQ